MNISLNRATNKDCDLLFNWVNDEMVRENSFNKNKILYENHVIWFNNRINSDKCIIFILSVEDIHVGQVRIDIENETAVISYSIDKNYRRKGLAVEMLSLLEAKIMYSKINISKLIGYVKFDNTSSQKVFENLQYNKIAHDSFLEYYKLLFDKGVVI